MSINFPAQTFNGLAVATAYVITWSLTTLSYTITITVAPALDQISSRDNVIVRYYSTASGDGNVSCRTDTAGWRWSRRLWWWWPLQPERGAAVTTVPRIRRLWAVICAGTAGREVIEITAREPDTIGMFGVLLLTGMIAGDRLSLGSISSAIRSPIRTSLARRPRTGRRRFSRVRRTVPGRC